MKSQRCLTILLCLAWWAAACSNPPRQAVSTPAALDRTGRAWPLGDWQTSTPEEETRK